MAVALRPTDYESIVAPQPDAAVPKADQYISPSDLEGVLNETVMTSEIDGVAHVGSIELPYKLALPCEIRYQQLGIFSSGFGGFDETSKAPVEAFAERGLAVARYPQIRADHGKWYQRLNDAQYVHRAAARAVAQDIAYNPDIRRQLPQNTEEFDPERRISITHSMGGLAVDDEAEGAIYLATVGFGTPKLRHLARINPLQVVKSVICEVKPLMDRLEAELGHEAAQKAQDYFLLNMFRTIGEARSCLKEDQRPKAVERSERGMRQVYLGFQYDWLVRPQEATAEFVDVFRILRRAGHIAPLIKADQVAKASLDLYFDQNQAA